VTAHDFEQLIARQHQLGDHCHEPLERINRHADRLAAVLGCVVILGRLLRYRGFGRFDGRRIHRGIAKNAFEFI